MCESTQRRRPECSGRASTSRYQVLTKAHARGPGPKRLSGYQANTWPACCLTCSLTPLARARWSARLRPAHARTHARASAIKQAMFLCAYSRACACLHASSMSVRCSMHVCVFARGKKLWGIMSTLVMENTGASASKLHLQELHAPAALAPSRSGSLLACTALSLSITSSALGTAYASGSLRLPPYLGHVRGHAAAAASASVTSMSREAQKRCLANDRRCANDRWVQM